ncbi:MAG: hypothetical protein ACI8UX_001583 [Psychromonas sp.]|jgi:hypothetical protein
MKQTVILTLFILLTTSCNLLPGDFFGQEEGQVELYETDSDDFPLLVVDADGTSFLFSQDLKSLYLEFINSDQWLIQLGPDGLPSDLLIKNDSDEYLIQFGPFNGDLSSIVLVDQNSGKKTFVSDIEFKGISDASSSFIQEGLSQKNLRPRATSIDFSSWFEANKGTIQKIGGVVAKSVSLGLCGVSIKAAVVSGGFLTAIAIANCGSFAASIASSNIKNDGAAIVVKSGTLPGKFAEAALKCASLDKSKCIAGAAGAAIAVGTFLSTAKNRNINIEASRTLAAFVTTGGLAGTWENESTIEGIKFKQSYYFGLDGGLYEAASLQQTSDAEVRTTIKIDFKYTLLPNEQLNINFQTILQTFRLANLQNGTTKEQQIGPISWDSYVTNYGQNGNGTTVDNPGTFGYELSEDKTELTFNAGENSLTMKRKEEIDLVIGKISI